MKPTDPTPPENAAEGAAEKAAPEPVTVQSRIAERREAMARGESIVPVPEAEEEEGATPEPEEGEEAAEEEAGVDAPQEEPGDDADAEGTDAGVEEGEEAPAAEKEEAVEDDGEGAEGEDADAEAAEDFVEFTLPPRNAEGDEVPVEIPAELEEDFRRLKNGYLRGEEARAVKEQASARVVEVRDAEKELELIDAELDADPAGFLLGRVAVEHRREVLRALLASDEVWDDDEIQDEMEEWRRDPKARRLFKAEQERERLVNAESRRTELRARQEVRDFVSDTGRKVARLIPDDMPKEKQDGFFRMAMRQIGERVEDPSTPMTEEQVVSLLEQEGILAGFGIDPSRSGSSAGSAPSDGSGGRSAKNGSSPRRARSASLKVDPEEARATGERLKEKSKARRRAAAAAPAGAGAPASRVELPATTSVKDRIAHVRKVGLAAYLDGS